MDLEAYARAGRELRGWEPRFEPEPLGDAPPWDYEAHGRELSLSASRVLDLGTGGGEVFSRMLPSRGRSYATEEWHRNAPVAARRLAPLGCVVVRAASDRLPFRGASFDLVLSRHEAILPREIARVLAHGGRFLTQQCMPDDWAELRRFFPEMTHSPDHLSEYPRGLVELGLEIEVFEQHRRRVCFRELGPLVYWLAASPWLVPDFAPDSHAAALAELGRLVRREGAILLSEGRYLLQVRDVG